MIISLSLLWTEDHGKTAVLLGSLPRESTRKMVLTLLHTLTITYSNNYPASPTVIHCRNLTHNYTPPCHRYIVGIHSTYVSGVLSHPALSTSFLFPPPFPSSPFSSFCFFSCVLLSRSERQDRSLDAMPGYLRLVDPTHRPLTCPLLWE